MLINHIKILTPLFANFKARLGRDYRDNSDEDDENGFKSSQETWDEPFIPNRSCKSGIPISSQDKKTVNFKEYVTNTYKSLLFHQSTHLISGSDKALLIACEKMHLVGYRTTWMATISTLSTYNSSNVDHDSLLPSYKHLKRLLKNSWFHGVIKVVINIELLSFEDET